MSGHKMEIKQHNHPRNQRVGIRIENALLCVGVKINQKDTIPTSN